MMIVAVLTVRRSELDAFRAFETIAARLLRAHGAELERTIVVDDGASQLLEEIHLLRFADEASYRAYTAEAELAAAKPLRDRAVVSTQLWQGEEGPRY